MLNNLNFQINYLHIFENDSGAVGIARNGSFTKKSRHIRVAVDFITDLINKGEIIVSKVFNADNIADIFTKLLRKI